ncbi:hypothetical protein DFH28DRAFT_1124768 [Melampsora americana]|nr:hypothetical protein DFH28DRAFT_1124768 [Melampsora americana]
MSSQTSCVCPYSLTTPRANRNSGVSSTSGTLANHAKQRALCGQDQQSMRLPIPNDNEGLKAKHLLAAIASLGAKVEQELLMLFDYFNQELSQTSMKINGNIATLSTKVGKQSTLMFEKGDQNFIILSNKMNQVNETVGAIASNHLPANGLSSAAIAANVPVASSQPWDYSTEVKDCVSAFAYQHLWLPAPSDTSR